MHRRLRLAAVALAFAFSALPSAAMTIDWVTVGDLGNAPDVAANCYGVSCGSVAYDYRISKYEVTNAQYAEFLNWKAASDPLALYNTSMSSSASGGITRSGSSGSYTYAVKAGFADKPVVFVSFFDALRFANWLHNGQGGGDTETGAYTLLGGTPTPSNGATVMRNSGAIAFLPSENEWYKAAYYDALSASYFDYPAGSDLATICSAPTATPNHANCGNLGLPERVTDVGAYSGSPSPYGTFDQGGNVDEWTEQIVSDPLAPGGDPRRAARGGHWGGAVDDSSDLAASSLASLCLTCPAGTNSSGVGFRVASLVPEPGTSLLVMLGLSVLAGRQRSTPSRPSE